MRLFLFLTWVTLGGLLQANAETKTAVETGISYYDSKALATATEYQKEQCKLDIYHVVDAPAAPTLIWFHGGGLTGGHREFPNLKDHGINLVAVGYRLSPKGELPCFLEDAAAATAWTIQNISKYGGDPKKVFVGGHSAGGYLTLMIGMDPQWLKPYGISIHDLAGLIPVSAQVTTHFTVKKLRGDTGDSLRPIIDEYAPLYYSAKELPPICLITGDRKIEWKSRVEENALLDITLTNLGQPMHEFHEMPGFDHGSILNGSMPLIEPFIDKVVSSKK
ncbi:alpha/beta hydrolase [Luteolibacter pohnpeiensis]|uniref:Alpha/beta hydrolase n=1 Tax=Luteolibacter pohnpeiensis TaxID=454153 RepID=A0A934S4E0_9BACT|nr:alpha/beta hydrolase [Luteolibacter pohnpeiensis]MBK1881698.1 alpha/beta hydrolase [Luteolibacter pohnpeiensis]